MLRHPFTHAGRARASQPKLARLALWKYSGLCKEAIAAYERHEAQNRQNKPSGRDAKRYHSLNIDERILFLFYDHIWLSYRKEL